MLPHPFKSRMPTFEKYYKPKEVCELLRIDRRTLWKWIKGGKIRVIKLPSGRHRIPESEIKRILGEVKHGN